MTTTPSVGNEVVFEPDTLPFPIAEQPRVTALADDGFVFSFQVPDRAGIEAFPLDEGGNAIANNFLQGFDNPTDPGTQVQTTSPFVVQESNGAVVTDFQERFPGETSDDIAAAPIDPTLQTFSFAVGQTASGIERIVDAVPTAQGSAVAFQTEDGIGSQTKIRWIDPNGSANSPDVTVGGTGETGFQENAALAPSGTDLVTVAYTHIDPATGNSVIRLQSLTPNGSTGEPIDLSDTTSHANFPDIAKLPDGSFIVVYQDNVSIVIKHISAAGMVDAAVRAGNSFGGIAPKVVAFKDDSFVVEWSKVVGTQSNGQADEDMFLHSFVFTPAGPGSPTPTITDAGDLAHIAEPWIQNEANMTALADGRLVLAYQSQSSPTPGVFNMAYRIIDPRDPGALLTGTEGDDTIVAEQTDSRIVGLGGNDTIVLGPGNDLADGGPGNNTVQFNAVAAAVHVDLAGGPVVNGVKSGIAAGQGTDEFVNFQNVAGSRLDDTILGNSANNVLDGGLGNDMLDGRGGVNTVSFQSFPGNNVNVDLSEGTATGQGTDTLRNFSNVVGSNSNDIITGNNGNNILDGKGGADVMRGLRGNDTYVVDNTGDVVNEFSGQGTDTVLTGVSYTLGAGQSIEILKATNPADTSSLNLTGNELSQAIIGNAGPNFINGGVGNDTLTGLGGADTFVFKTALDARTNVDKITDFDPSVDKIQLSSAIFDGLPAGALSDGAFFMGPAAHAPGDRIIYNSTTGALSYDSNGDAPGGATQFATLSPGLALHAGNFDVM